MAGIDNRVSWNTPVGNFVMRHSTMTQIDFWKDLIHEVESIADAGGDWRQLLEERIAGMQEYLRRRDEEGAPGNWVHHGTQTEGGASTDG